VKKLYIFDNNVLEYHIFLERRQ